MTDDRLTRRNVLAGLGAGGLAATGLGFGGLAFATRPALAHTNQMETEVEGNDLVFEWVETYNGETIENEISSPTADPPGMTISLQNVLPGDAGALGIEMSLVSDSDTSDPSVTPYFAFDLTETAENGRNEPERKAGDTSTGTDGGELQEYIDVKIWYDTGLMYIQQLGESNNEQNFGEGLIDQDAEGTLAEVAKDLPDSVDLDNADPIRLEPETGDCLGTDNSVIIAFGWEFADRPGVNVTQSDSVSFDLLFRGEGGCET